MTDIQKIVNGVNQSFSHKYHADEQAARIRQLEAELKMLHEYHRSMESEISTLTQAYARYGNRVAGIDELVIVAGRYEYIEIGCVDDLRGMYEVSMQYRHLLNANSKAKATPKPLLDGMKNFIESHAIVNFWGDEDGIPQLDYDTTKAIYDVFARVDESQWPDVKLHWTGADFTIVYGGTSNSKRYPTQRDALPDFLQACEDWREQELGK